jgi:ribosomal protein L24E
MSASLDRLDLPICKQCGDLMSFKGTETDFIVDDHVTYIFECSKCESTLARYRQPKLMAAQVPS